MTRATRAIRMAGVAATAFVAQTAWAPAQGQRSATASMAGIVVTGATNQNPVSAATVTIRDVVQDAGRVVVADGDGRFAADLPSGRYIVSASHAGFLDSRYGAAQPGIPPVVVNLRSGEVVSDIILQMIPSASISGSLKNEMGSQLAGFLVEAARYPPTGDLQALPFLDRYEARADDRGDYRLHGLPPGRYVLVAKVPVFTTSNPTLDAWRDDPDRNSYVPTYFPGTPSVFGAVPINVAAGQEVTSADLRLVRVPPTTLRVTMKRGDGGLIDGVRLALLDEVPVAGGSPRQRLGVVDPDGVAVFDDVSTGRYVLVAHLSEDARAGEGNKVTFWSVSEFHVSQTSTHEEQLAMWPGSTVSGTVVFGEAAGVAPDVSSVRLRLARSRPLGRATAAIGVADVAPDGAFRFSSVPPGEYVVESYGGRPVSGGWMVDDAVLDGRSVVDGTFTISTAGDVTGLVVTLVNEQTELTGFFETPEGQRGSDYFIVVFSQDPAWRGGRSRRSRVLRPATDGRFSVRGLPAGDYLVAAVTAVGPGAVSDPEYLETLVPHAVAVTLQAGQQTVQDFRVRR